MLPPSVKEWLSLHQAVPFWLWRAAKMVKAAKDCGLPVAQEVFADRAYEEDGSLVSRTKPGAMITEEQQAIRRVLTMVLEGKVAAITGKEIPLCADSICVHGDGEKTLLFVKKVQGCFGTVWGSNSSLLQIAERDSRKIQQEMRLFVAISENSRRHRSGRCLS